MMPRQGEKITKRYKKKEKEKERKVNNPYDRIFEYNLKQSKLLLLPIRNPKTHKKRKKPCHYGLQR